MARLVLRSSTQATTQLTTLAIESAESGSLPWTFGHAFKEGDVPSGHYISLPNGQAHVLNVWPDGSAKQALLSGYSVAGSVAISRSPSALGGTNLTTADLVATGITAAIAMGTPSASWSGSDWTSPFQQTAAGPVMSSWLYRKQLGSDTHLVGWMEVRLYSGGEVQVMAWIENGYTLVTSPGAKTGRATFTLGGTVRYDSNDDSNYTSAYSFACIASGVLGLPHHYRAVLASDGAHCHWLGSDPGVTPAHNRTYFESTKVIPKFMPVSIDSSTLSSLTAVYSPMRVSYSEVAMGEAGDDGWDIGFMPRTAGMYVVSPSANTFRAILAHGLSLGAYCIHYRDEGTNKPLLFADHPALSLNSGTAPPSPSGGHAHYYASSHHPASCYLPYLVSGWHWFVEEMQFQTIVHYLARNASTSLSSGRGTGGNYLFASTADGAGLNEKSGLRAQGWQWRSCAMSASCTPDADTTLRAQFITALGYNATFKITEHTTGAVGRASAPNDLGLSVEPASFNDGGFQITAPWQDDFITMSVGFTVDLKVVTSSTPLADLIAYRDFKYQCIVGRGGAQNDVDAFNYREMGSTYQFACGPYNGESFIWFDTWGEVGDEEYGANSGRTGMSLTPRASIAFDFTSSSWGDAWVALCYAVDHGAPGAADAYARIIGASNYSTMISTANTDPRRAIVPRTV